MKEIYRSADLLVRPRIGYESPFCVVTFDSFTDRRTLDREGFGEAFLASRAVNAIHVLSRDNDWYLLPDIELALDAAAKAAASFDRVSAYGSSMGAYAAIRLGGLAGASTAIALSPQFSIDPRLVPFEDRWDPDARRLNFEIERRLALKGFVASAMFSTTPRIATRAMSSSIATASRSATSGCRIAAIRSRVFLLKSGSSSARSCGAENVRPGGVRTRGLGNAGPGAAILRHPRAAAGSTAKEIGACAPGL